MLGLLFGTVRLNGIGICGDGGGVRGFVRGIVSDGLGLARLVVVYLLAEVFSVSGKGRRDVDALVGGSRGGHLEFGRRRSSI